MLKIVDLGFFGARDFLHNISISTEDLTAAYILLVFAEMQPTFWLA